MEKVRVLGIESSCDDTAAAIVDSDLKILANIVISQNDSHKVYRGVVPEIAARSHMTNLEFALTQCLKDAKLKISDIDVIAATCGPGLIGGVIVGAVFGKAIASVLNKPFIAINHLEGHALTVRLTHSVPYPYLLLLVSGGHCQYVAVKGLGDYKIIGQTLDDAIGESFDKVAKMLGIEFPGGPKIEQIAKEGDENRFILPKPIINKGCDMSFSGLKTAVRLKIEELAELNDQDAKDIAASFQKTVTEILYKKTKSAIAIYENENDGKNLVIAGGVAANLKIRETLQNVSVEAGYNFVAPPIKLCTDNAAMIAFAGLERFKAGIVNAIDFNPRARWNLEDI